MRTVIVQSPSVWRETVGVIRVVLHVAFWSAAIMLAPAIGKTQAAGSQLAVDEVAFAALDADTQQMYRRCLAGLADAEAQRARTGQWPTIEAEAARGVAPFADPTGYHWRMLHDGLITNYVGVAPGGVLAIVIWEPDPGMGPDPLAVVDEQHHKLPDGTLLHVSVWTGAKDLERAASTPAFEDGWRRITEL